MNEQGRLLDEHKFGNNVQCVESFLANIRDAKIVMVIKRLLSSIQIFEQQVPRYSIKSIEDKSNSICKVN